MTPRAGIGLRAPHHAAVLAGRPAVGWLEAHSENYFGGGHAIATLERLRADYPIALHGVGLSLGTTDPLDARHLARLAKLATRIDPMFVSEHLCWGHVGGRHSNELLPLPYTSEALRHFARRVGEVQDAFGREILIENVSSYLVFSHGELTEWEFVAALAAEARCGLLLDINNIHVNAINHGFDPAVYLEAIPVDAVRELHLAGHLVRSIEGRELCIDTHDRPVCAAVWTLYERALARFGPLPTLIEWDAQLPTLDVLVDEALTADALLRTAHAHVA